MESVLVGVVALALVLAVAMGVIAWRVLHHDRVREDARVALLRSLADTPDTATTLAPVAQGILLGAADRPAGTRGWAIVAMALIGLSTGVGVTYAVYRPDDRVASSTPDTRPPLELVALSHARSDEGVFRISGVIANPQGGTPRTRLMAVVSLFDTDGTYLDSATAPVTFPTVAAGDESPFTLQVSTRARIARYRLVFREEQGGQVAHVDRRHTTRAGASDIDASRP